MQEWLVVGLQQRLERLNVELVAVIHDEVIVQSPQALLMEGIVQQAMIGRVLTFTSTTLATAGVLEK